MAILYRLH